MPLSFAQQRLWFIAQLEGPSAVYNCPVALRLDGDLDAAALEAALGDVIARHEVLRTVFPAADGQPYQRVLGMGELGWELPVTAVAEEDLPGALARVGGGAVRPGRAGPGAGPAAGRGARRARAGAGDPPRRHRRLVDRGCCARDLSARRTRRGWQGRAPGWAPLPVQYADYAIWQRELLGDADDPGSLLSRQVAWWREALAGAPPELALPADRPRPAAASHRGHAVPLAVPARGARRGWPRWPASRA